MRQSISPQTNTGGVAAGGGDPRRIDLIDALRAIALFGVIAMNYNAMVMAFVGPAKIAAAGPIDLVASTVDLVLLQGKARSVFATLFGVGFGLLMMRADRNGTSFAAWYLRRMAILLAIGIGNLAFLFWGDILILYAVFGMAMLAVRHWTDRALAAAGLALVMVPPLLLGAAQALAGGRLPPLLGGVPFDPAGAAPIYGHGDYPAFVEANLARYVAQYLGDRGDLLVYDAGVFGLFLLGFWIARRGMLVDPAPWRPALRRIAAVCLPIGLGLSALHATQRMGVGGGALYPLATAAYVGLPILAFGYASVLVLLLGRGRGRAIALLAPLGRMALTGYLLSNLIGAMAFYGWGLGAMGSVNLAGINLLAIGVSIVLCIGSRAWLGVFRQGPVESVWRRLSGLPPKRSEAPLRPAPLAA